MANFTGQNLPWGGEESDFAVPAASELGWSLTSGVTTAQQVDFAFVVIAFDPLRGSFIDSTETSLKLNLQQVNGTLNTMQVQIKLNKVLIYGVNADPGQPGVITFAPDFVGSSINNLGGGAFQFDLQKSTNWITGIRNEVILLLPAGF